MDVEIFLHTEAWIALLTLTFLEVVLGIDNIIFISIVTNKLPEENQRKARNIGLLLALVFRILLLMSITYIIGLTEPLFTVGEFAMSSRDLVLAIGGLFLLAKSTSEIHHKMEGETQEEAKKTTKKRSFSTTIIQIILLDIVFSFDSILTAVGLTDQLAIMVTAVIVAMIIMMIFAGAVSAFISRHPTLQILALSFLILIGFMLMLESIHYEIPKGYMYFAVFFSLIVEVINIKVRKKR
jgi:predicted tellurium resistance membrane protein TerC